MTLRDALRAIPDPPLPAAPPPALASAIADSARYLSTDAALRSIAADPYWPKWDSPWWHMVALFELGEARRIPAAVAHAMAARLDTLLHVFPIAPGDAPPGTDLARDVACHCALGCMAQVLAACEPPLDPFALLPWLEPWFVRYQMADGGLSCDETAYTCGECASSMVGTIAAFEAMLLGAPAAWSPARRAFVDRAAAFLVGRELRLGSETAHNAEERGAAPAWLAPTFPRFYFYDVLRGLAALVRWAEQTGGAIPAAPSDRTAPPSGGAARERSLPSDRTAPPSGGAARERSLPSDAVVRHLVHAFPDGVVRVQRHAFAGKGTWAEAAPGAWARAPHASMFPLLLAASEQGVPSLALTRQWTAARHGLLRLGLV